MSVKGCYTDFHIDFGGTSVWYHVFKGKKVNLITILWSTESVDLAIMDGKWINPWYMLLCLQSTLNKSSGCPSGCLFVWVNGRTSPSHPFKQSCRNGWDPIEGGIGTVRVINPYPYEERKKHSGIKGVNMYQVRHRGYISHTFLPIECIVNS